MSIHFKFHEDQLKKSAKSLPLLELSGLKPLTFFIAWKWSEMDRNAEIYFLSLKDFYGTTETQF